MTPSEARRLLQVSDTATTDEIKAAYRRSSVQWHPDRHGNSPVAKEAWQRINDAKQVLLDPAPPATPGAGLGGLLDALLTTAEVVADPHNVKVVNKVVGEKHGSTVQAALSTWLDLARGGGKPK